jgi:Ca2+-binding RTX toxin-like protein
MVDMDDGAYTYQYHSAFIAGETRSMDFVISDNDKDTSAAKLTIGATGGITITPNYIRDDYIYLRVNSGAVNIPVYALLANDIDPSYKLTDISLVANSAGDASVSYDSNTGLFSFTFNSNTLGQFAHFQYSALSNGLTQTGFVTVEQVGGDDPETKSNHDNTAVATVSGSGFGDIIIDTVNDSGTNTNNGLAGNDVIIGTTSAETLNGGDGNDLLVGNGGNDILNGGNGNDILRGGAGNDTIDGGSGFDMIDFSDASISASTTGLNMTLGLSTVTTTLSNIPGSLGDDKYTGIEGVIGTPGKDTITGNAEDNIFRGGGGDDKIDGAGGNDIIDFSDATGALGTVATPFNLVTDALNYNSVTVGGLGTDQYRGIEGVIGTPFADVINGNSSNNVLSGSGGDDMINPKGGNDMLSGGSGNDTFIFGTEYQSGPAKNVIITDFKTGDITKDPNADTIDLKSLLTDEHSNTLGDYLDFTSNGVDTTISVKPAGILGSVALTITLNAVDLTHNGTQTEAQIINTMLMHQNLKADS